jgi:hypothetical protein
MTRTITRTATVVALAGGIAAGLAAPALADSGRLANQPGLASDHASCVGSALDFAAHYGTDGDSYPVVVHGAVGPTISADATTDGPGAVGDFNSTLAAQHGTVMVCLP